MLTASLVISTNINKVMQMKNLIYYAVKAIIITAIGIVTYQLYTNLIA